MNFYILFTIFLYIGGCNTRVVPLSFKVDESNVESSVSENELIDESPEDEVEILGHSLPDIEKSDDSQLLISQDKNTSVLEISNRNSSNLTVASAFSEKSKDKELNIQSTESSLIADIPDEELNLSSEFISKNDSDSKEPLKSFQVNGTLDVAAIEPLTLETEAFNTNNSSGGLEQENNIEFAETEEKLLNDAMDHQNETAAIFEALSDFNDTESFLQLQPKSNATETENIFPIDASNITEEFGSTNSSAKSQSTSNVTVVEEVVLSDAENITEEFKLSNETIQSHPISNNTEVDVFLNDVQNITEELKASNLTTENLEKTNNSINSAGGIFSGFDFLINSEVARNAAKAMEVFNFSDHLTDHIMEENEFHSFLPEFHAEQNLDSAKIEFFTNGSEGKTSEFHQADSEETLMLLNQTEGKQNSSMPFNLNKPLEVRNETELMSLPDEIEGNLKSNISSPLENPEGTIHLVPEATILEENINGSASNSSIVGVAECPPPGWCIFWFLSQDTCAVNDHCLGSRICCKIGCSKTCIDIES